MLDAYFESPENAYLYLEPLAQKGAKNTINVNNKTFLSGSLILPVEEAEQRKIADALASFDDLASALAQKLAALKNHKKGLMQQIFPAKGESMPRLRFPEFRNAAPWKMRTLADVLIEHGNKSTGAEDVFSVSVHKGLVNQVEHLGRSFSAASTSHYNRVMPGDVVYTKSPTGDFPLGVIKQSKLDFDVIVSPLYGVFSPKTSALGALLDAYFESPENAYLYLEPLAQKGAKNTINVNNKTFLSGSLILPVEEAEQRKIADALASFDDLASALAQKLAALKNHKKGLMQQLFPTIDEVRE